jgi:hypothetical protein
MRQVRLGILALGFLGLGLFVAAMLAHRKDLALPGSLMAGLAGAGSLLRCQKAGLVRTRQGIVRRADRPALFRFHMGFGWTAVLLWTLGGVLFGLGIFDR